MYRIARIRCASVGPPDARYDRPSPDAPHFELSCVGADGQPTHSLAWLENGGGKTVLLALLFHVVRPDKAAQIGKDQSGRSGDFSDYVLGDDVAHVVIEWVADDSDERLFTGIVGERKGATTHRTWYLLSVRAAEFGLDDLVFEVDGHRVTSSRYIESLQTLVARAGRAARRSNRVDLVKTTTQRTWLETLANHNLDPALFEYQVRMNRAEGGASGLFRFNSPEQFVEFFLDLTLNTDTVTGLSETLRRVAAKAAALPEKELELEHASGAVERLGALAGAWRGHEEADRAEADARAAVWRLDDMLAAAQQEQEGTVNGLEESLRVAFERQAAADKARREADDRARGLAILAADARVESAAHLAKVRKDELLDAQLTADGWRKVPDRIELNRLAGEASGLRAVLQHAEAEATPLRDVRDANLRSLRVALAELRDRAAKDLETASQERDTAAGLAEVEEAALRKALTDVSRAEARAEVLERSVNVYASHLTAARRGGLIGAEETPAQAVGTCEQEVESARLEQEAQLAEAKRLEESLPALGEATKRAATTADELGRRAAAAQEKVTAAEDERAELARHPLLAELGADDPDLELVGTELAMRVAGEAGRRRAEAIAIAAEAAEDRRAAEALERNNLLPPRKEVEKLCAELHAAGVLSAVPGWRQMVETASAGDHEALIEAQPALVEGIVVAESDLERARALVAEIRPAAAVVVGSPSALAVTASRDHTFVVPPARAMHSRVAAEEEMLRRQGLLDEAGRHQEEAAAAEGAARSLAERLTSHFEAWPVAALGRAIAAASAKRLEADQAAKDAALASGLEDRARSELAQSSNRARTAGRRLDTAQQRLLRLAPLANEEEAASEAQKGIEACATEKTAAEGRVESARQNLGWAKGALTDANERRQAAIDAKRGLVTRLGHLSDPGEGPAASPGPLESLQAAYDAAEEALAAATTGSEAARRLAGLEERQSALRASFERLAAELVSRVDVLAGTATAADPDARQGALESATAAVGRAVTASSEAEVTHGLAVARRQELRPPDRALDPTGFPKEPAQLEAIAAEAEEAALQAREARVLAEEASAKTAAALDETKSALDKLVTRRSTLETFVVGRTREPAAPFTGDAQQAVTKAVADLRRCGDAAREADAAWRDAAHQVGVFAREDRWSTLSGDLPRRLRDDAQEDLARSASDLATQTRILAERLAEDIAALDTHRQLLVTSLTDAVSEGARSLRRARTKSVLPDGLGDWSGHPFLKISLEIPSDRAEMASRLRRFVNDILERAPVAGYPTGAALVCRALLACSEKAVRVEVLKPHRSQRLHYVPVHDMALLSGGMRATAAIAMFCTLAKVRATNQTGRSGVGTLILDNPLGDANATYLVRLQLLMARLSDVQLLFTTGVNDMDAIRLFPVITRLTNEAAKRSHLSYVIADEAFLKRLMASDSEYSLVTGSRLVRNQPLELVVESSDPGAD